ncbi:hypothetical protein [Polynucleobacter asymbioticus]|jgi:hypothetical protein|uniref:Auto-transporter adhesin head GIN domain-containing protein n=3 Tax=Polynucleobacter asymbioticus TaxID=576611 RepID=A4SXZ6_POLAQ|nr:hypothetical protein [Polynucleobacter asymbioticus]ABP34360.1 hypothetical protein Pnuc_1144 [Polynucleobacter asymbioticus QLW-P1DMWA-1]APC06204.1 hypothetical protein AOC10_06530 [Polynucleobacter asymbioticus]
MKKMAYRVFIFITLMMTIASAAQAADMLLFDCQRVEKNYTEDYEMKIVPATVSQKAKIYLDDRDLDQSDANGTQVVKSIVINASTILINIQASFEPEVLNGITYSAGTFSTQINLNRNTGKLTKTEEIHGGILGANLGNGTHLSEETCQPAKVR